MRNENEKLNGEPKNENDLLKKFKESTTKLDEKLINQRRSKETTCLGFIGFTTFEVGEASGTKQINHGKSPPKVTQRTFGKKSYKPICFNCHKVGHTANVYRIRSTNRSNTFDGYIAIITTSMVTLLMIVDLDPLVDLVALMVTITIATNMVTKMMSVGQE